MRNDIIYGVGGLRSCIGWMKNLHSMYEQEWKTAAVNTIEIALLRSFRYAIWLRKVAFAV